MADGFVVAPEGGQAIDLPDWSMLVKVDGVTTGGALTVIHARLGSRHRGPAEHIHDGHDETFVIVAGRLRFRLDNQYHIVDAGSTVFAPRGCAHGFSNPFEHRAAYVAMLTPWGYEHYFERIADHVKRTGDLPDQATTEDWMAAVGTRLAKLL